MRILVSADMEGATGVTWPADGGAEEVLVNEALRNSITGVRVNGEPASEGKLNALIAAEFGVPVILVTGDDVTCADAGTYAPRRRGPGRAAGAARAGRRADRPGAAQQRQPDDAERRVQGQRDPGEAVAQVDGRVLPGTEDEFTATMNELTGPDVTWEYTHREMPLEAPLDVPLMTAMTEVVAFGVRVMTRLLTGLTGEA